MHDPDGDLRRPTLEVCGIKIIEGGALLPRRAP